MTNRYLANSTPHDDYSDEHEFCVMDTKPFVWEIVCWCDSEELAELIAKALNEHQTPKTSPVPVATRMVSGPYPGDIWDFVFEFEDEP